MHLLRLRNVDPVSITLTPAPGSKPRRPVSSMTNSTGTVDADGCSTYKIVDAIFGLRDREWSPESLTTIFVHLAALSRSPERDLERYSSHAYRLGQRPAGRVQRAVTERSVIRGHRSAPAISLNRVLLFVRREAGRAGVVTSYASDRNCCLRAGRENRRRTLVSSSSKFSGTSMRSKQRFDSQRTYRAS